VITIRRANSSTISPTITSSRGTSTGRGGLTDAYPEYHLGTALALLPTAVDRHAKIMVAPEPMFPNVWTLLVGQSTVSRKSTALSLGREVLETAELGDKRLPEDFSPEAFIDELEEYPQAIFLKDAFGEFLAKRGRDYRSGIAPLLSSLYDCPPEYDRTLRHESMHVEDVYLTLAGACAPGQVTRNVSIRASGRLPTRPTPGSRGSGSTSPSSRKSGGGPSASEISSTNSSAKRARRQPARRARPPREAQWRHGLLAIARRWGAESGV